LTVFPWPVSETGEGWDFESHLPFPPDDFQRQAFRALDADRSVLVSAPTGSGKTLVAAYAVHRALQAGGKAFYTTPLKALSNQKYGELVATYGKDHVGLLTGDTAVKPEAPVVVMTTEVLRNMLLAGSDLLRGLHTVVLDEVHFIQDPYRGGVWEEVLVLSPPEIRFVCLSATVNNASELGQWLRSVRGDTDVIVERHRPIILRHLFAAQRREDDQTLLVPLLSHGKAGGEGQRIDQAVRRAMHGRPQGWQPRGKGPRLPYRSPLRTELITALDADELLPAIVFIFSRAACDDAVHQVVRDGVRLTDRDERATIRQIAEARVETLSDEDLGVLGYDDWLEGLEAGVAAHHAGLVPVFRETVEECFAAGLLRVVFATETLSLGINMPARTVVIERFTKYGGAGRASLTSGEYLQLTGRAGRRGLDEEGHAVVVWSSETTFGEAARVAMAPPPDLRSSFRPTYNLAVNLISRFDQDTANEVLHRSFAQWQAKRPDLLSLQLSHRVAVLEELGYVKDWTLTESGRRLARIYHESDLLVAEALAQGLLDGTEPAILAGVVSSVVFEPRRARRLAGPRGGPRGARPPVRRDRRKGSAADRLGEKRRADLQWRCESLALTAEHIRAAEETYLVPRTRQPSSGLATAVVSWARGASFETVLGVAARDVGDVAPGDFVRTMKSVADLVQQVAHVATDPATQRGAREAVGLLVRGVVAVGLPVPEV
jgi:superfamily II RNA helicase